jgi:DNA-binding MarR family transcriptional regulator
MVADAAAAKALARYGLTFAQFHALSAVVHAHAHPRARTDHHLLAPSYAMGLPLIDLEMRGLINRTPRERRGQRARVRPTDAGLRVAQLATSALDAVRQRMDRR